MKSTILKIDGIFLTVMGTLAAVMDLAGHFANKGPFATTYYQKTVVIGGLEAHCLAAILGVVLLVKRNANDNKFYNKVAIVIHAVLMICNLVWFDAFRETDTLPMGYIATAFHFLFILFNFIAIYRTRALRAA
jgi:hypothetical protein